MRTIISRAMPPIAVLVVVINCVLVYRFFSLSNTPSSDDTRTLTFLLDEMDQDKARESVNIYNSCKEASSTSTREEVRIAVQAMEQLVAIQDSALNILEKIRSSAINPEDAENHFTDYKQLILRNKKTLTAQSGVQISWYLGGGIINGEKLLNESILSPDPNLIILKSLALRNNLLLSINVLLRDLCSG